MVGGQSQVLRSGLESVGFMVGVIKRVTGEFRSVCAMMAALLHCLCFKIDA